MSKSRKDPSLGNGIGSAVGLPPKYDVLTFHCNRHGQVCSNSYLSETLTILSRFAFSPSVLQCHKIKGAIRQNKLAIDEAVNASGHME